MEDKTKYLITITNYKTDESDGFIITDFITKFDVKKELEKYLSSDGLGAWDEDAWCINESDVDIDYDWCKYGLCGCEDEDLETLLTANIKVISKDFRFKINNYNLAI